MSLPPDPLPVRYGTEKSNANRARKLRLLLYVLLGLGIPVIGGCNWVALRALQGFTPH